MELDLVCGGTSVMSRGDRLKSDLGKLAPAAGLRREATLTMGWIVVWLQVGTCKSTVAKPHRSGKKTGESNSTQAKTMV